MKLSGPLSEVININVENRNNFTLRILPEVLFSIPVAMYFPKNHFLDDVIDPKINILHSAGLIDYFIAKFSPRMLKEESLLGPKKLTFNQLAGGIYVYFAGCLISTFAFFAEKLIGTVKINR